MRPNLAQYYASMLNLVASRSTCPRRQVGAIITDYDGKVVSTGYNGVPSGYPHCIDVPCPGRSDESGNTARCYAVHAEANAILQAHTLEFAHTIYCSTQPCFECCKLLANTGIMNIFYLEPYPDTRGTEMLIALGHKVEQIEV